MILNEETRRIFWESAVNRAITSRLEGQTPEEILEAAKVFYLAMVNPPDFVTKPMNAAGVLLN